MKVIIKSLVAAMLLNSLLSACTFGSSWEADDRFTNPPLYRLKPSVFERQQIAWSPGLSYVVRLKGQGLFRSYSAEELNDIAKMIINDLIPSDKPKDFVLDKRFILISIDPNIVVTVPYRYKALSIELPKKIDATSDPLGVAIYKELEQIHTKDNENLKLIGGRKILDASRKNLIEVGCIFPQLEGSEIYSKEIGGLFPYEKGVNLLEQHFRLKVTNEGLPTSYLKLHGC